MARTVGSRTPLPISDLAKFNPNRADAVEAVWQPFYDKVTYAAAGQTTLTFFAVPRGQGGKTYADTNMDLAGQFPAPTAFLVVGIQILFLPANDPSTANAAPTAFSNWEDAIAVANDGWLEFLIGGKVYLRDSPIGKFTAVHGISGVAAVSGTFTAPAQTDVDYARQSGRYYDITPILIPQTQNFSVTLNWDVAVPITTEASVIATLDGFYYRKSQ